MRQAHLLLAAIISISAGCSLQRPVDVAKEENAIRSTDTQWLEAVREKDFERALTFWSDDALVMPPNSSPIVGKDAIRKFVSGAATDPNFSITWTTGNISVSRSGDLAYSSATNHITASTPDGKRVSEDNKGIVVWRKQADGSWKCSVDIWNAEAVASTK